MTSEPKEYLHKMYVETLQASRFHTFKILNTLIIALFVLLFMNVLFTTPDKSYSYISLIVAVVSVLFMFYRLTREKAGMKSLPEDLNNIDGDIIREHIDQIRNNQKIEMANGVIYHSFFIYFLIDLVVSSTQVVDKKFLF
jgi:Na+/melibiose symporter-like transporter